MPPPTSSVKPTAAKLNGAAGSKKDEAPAAASTSNASGSSRPDKAAYDAEQDGYNKEIAAVKTKLDAVRSRINLSQAPKGDDRRSQLKAELDALRGEQGNFKAARGKTLDEVKRLQEGLAKKIKDAQAQRGKIAYKNVGEIDQRIAQLEKQIESGSMKLVDEKKALQEVSTLKRSRRQLEASGSVDDAISADKAKIDELRKQLDDPERRKVSDKFDELKREMDGLREEGNKAYEERNKLFDERTALSAQMDELYGKKRESAQKYREDNDKYYAKVQADRQARQDRFKAEKAKEDAERQIEEISRMREDAKLPAYSKEIEDCQILIGWFQGKNGSEVPSTNAGGKGQTTLEGVKALEIRQVETEFKGMTLKKKRDDELAGFFGGSGKGKKKGGKGGAGSKAASGTATPAEGESSKKDAVNLPMSLLSAILSLGIHPPSGKDDVQRTVDDLETKKAWFEANSAAKTKTEIDRVEKLVAKMQKKNSLLAEDDDEEDKEVVDEAGGNKEPLHTAAVADSVAGEASVEKEGDHILPADASPTEEVKHVDSALEDIQEAS